MATVSDKSGSALAEPARRFPKAARFPQGTFKLNMDKTPKNVNSQRKCIVICG
jgi:hypothetical protein